ncbi:MAG: RdgB/HAM1 family non-canonical purine NTP pyrophosphatase [Pirellulales bacterium]
MPAELVLGTGNRKKLVELQDLFDPLGLRLSTLADWPRAIQVEETGDTFAANARLKAVEQARALGAWVLGEDSGLAVDALDGRPGVYSARFAGPSATDEANNVKLLADLAGTPLERRGARYVCHMTLSDPRGDVRAESEADCRGRILIEPRGEHGFGYDPLFEIPEYHCTFGELGLAVKWALSHRSRAGRMLFPQVARLLVAGEWPT